MRDFFIPFLGLQWFFAAASPIDNPLWERLLEKWGIAFVGIGLLFLFAKRTDRIAKEEKQKQDRLDKEEQMRRDKREADATEERNKLLKRNNELVENQTAAQELHSARLEKLTKQGTKAITDSEAAMRMLVRKMQRPCVAPFTFPLEETKEQETEKKEN